MKRITLCTVSVLLALFSLSQTQHPFYDALQLKKWAKENISNVSAEERDSIASIMGKYLPNSKVDTTNPFKTIDSLVKSNPYLEGYFKHDTIRAGQGNENWSRIFSSGIASIGGLDVTKYANAIADVLIDRAKQELTVAFFNRFKKFADENEEFKILFPKTTSNLNKLLSFTYPQMLPALRNGFFEDLKQVTYHLDDVFDLPRYRTLLENLPEVRVIIRSIRVVHELETGASNAADVIKEFAGFEEWNDETHPKIKSVGSCLKISALFSESIRNDTNQNQKDDVWVPAKELKDLFYDKVFFNIYLGLVYQQSIKDTIVYVAADGSSIPFKDILDEQRGDIFLFQNKLKEFFDLAGNVNTAFKEFKKKLDTDEKITDDDIYNYINTSIDVVEYGFSIAKIFHKVAIAEDYLTIVRKSNDLYKDIYSKNFSQAMGDGLDIFSGLGNLLKEKNNVDSLRNSASVKAFADTIQNNDVKKLIQGKNFLSPINDANVIAATQVSISDASVTQIVRHYNLEHILDFVEKVKPYALFMANMVEAKDEKEVKAALENVILPVGSSSIKKYSAGNVAVQTYLGAYLSFNNKNNINSTWSDKFGVIAPIGLSWTPGFTSFGKAGSISLFTSLFDLGAIVDYKLKQEPAPTNINPDATVIKKEYEVKLGQIISPGGYLVYGFGANLPLSFGIGAQYGPGLSKIDSDNSTIVNNPSWRGNFFLAVDMPFFTLKNKVKNK